MCSWVKCLIPSLSSSFHKGQAGRIGVLGGCVEYCGAPYFAGMSAMRIGYDFSYVFCSQEAAVPIKAYSPDLIVHPLGREENAASDFPKAMETLFSILPRLSCLVVGPGMGRSEFMTSICEKAISEARRLELPLVVDGDALRLVAMQPELVAGYSKVILTPNVVEYARFAEFSNGLSGIHSLGDKVCVVKKGKEDCIECGNLKLVCSEEGSMRRCAGQGDILAGSIGAFFGWSVDESVLEKLREMGCEYPPQMIAALGGCLITRKCSKLAYSEHGRSMITSEMLKFISVELLGK